MINTKLPSHSTQYDSGQTMEKYQRLHQIGQGSFGAVYLVRQVDTGEKLVVKQVNTAKITQSELQKVWDGGLTK